MTMQKVGLQAFLGGLQSFLSGLHQMTAAEERLAKAGNTVAATRVSSAARQATAMDRIRKAQITLDRATEDGAARVQKAQDRVRKALQAYESSRGQSAAIRSNLNQKLVDSERALATATTLSARKIADAHTSISIAQRKGVETGALAALANQRALIGWEAAGGKATRSMNLLGGAGRLLAGSMKVASQASHAFGRVLAAVAGYGNQAATAFRFGAAALVGLAAALTIGSAAKFQDTLSKINNLTELTTAQTKEFGDAVLEMSSRIPKSPDELGAAGYEALSRGITSVAAAIKITEQASKAAVAGYGDTKEIVIAITGVINAYGEANITAAQASDILFATVKVGGGEFSDYATQIGRVAQLGSNLGITFNQIGAAIATLTNVGIPATQSTTALLGILNQISSPSAEAEEALQAAGTSIQELRAQIREKGLIPALQDMLKGLDDQQGILEKLFPEVRGYSGALALLRGESEAYAKAQASVNKSVGIVDQAFEQNKNNLSNVAQILKNTLNRAFIDLGNKAMPSVTKAAQDLNEWIQKNKDSIIAFINDGVKAGIKFIKDFVAGVLQIVSAFKSIVGSKAATVAALTAIGAAMVWALPGGPIIKGLILITTLLGKSQGTGMAEDMEAIRAATEKMGSIGKGVGSLKLPGNMGADLLLKLQAQGVDVTKGVGELDRLQGKLDEAADAAKELGEQALPALPPGFKEATEGAAQLAEELKNLKQDFAESSAAAGQVESLTEAMKMFGEVGFDLAKSSGISATQAGNIQGIDAVARAEERATREAYNLTAALATIAQAFQQNAKVAGEIVLNLARTALQASQAAAQTLFSRPTREIANLNVSLARQSLKSAQASASTNPQISALNRQLASINRAIANARKQAEAANKLREAQNKAARAAIDRARDKLDAVLDRLKLTHLMARQAYERFNAGLERLIAATQKRASDLQEAFLKSNENLQRQINEAIGRGDRGGALALTNQQQAAAKAYQSQAKALERAEQDIITRQKKAALEEEEKERQRQLAEALAEAHKKQAEAVLKAMEAQIENNEAIEANTEGLEKQAEAVEAQIEKLQAVNEANSEAEARIQEQIAIYEAQNNILKAQVEAADKTLLSQSELRKEAGLLIKQIEIESGLIKKLSDLYGFHYIPEIDKANTAFFNMNEAARVLTDEGFRKTLIDKGIDPVAKRLEFLGTTLDKATASVNAYQRMVQAIADATGASNSEVPPGPGAPAYPINQGGGTGSDPYGPPVSLPSIPANTGPGGAVVSALKSVEGAIKSMIRVGPTAWRAEGGITSKPTLTWVSETNQQEAIIPLERPARAREILGSISPSLLASIMPQRSSGSVFAPNISVRGDTLETMEATALRAVRQAFRDARGMSQRTGGLITQGIGPTR